RPGLKSAAPPGLMHGCFGFLALPSRLTQTELADNQRPITGHAFRYLSDDALATYPTLLHTSCILGLCGRPARRDRFVPARRWSRPAVLSKSRLNFPVPRFRLLNAGSDEDAFSPSLRAQPARARCPETRAERVLVFPCHV